eukprot:SAG31_NODE_47567_length_235_cov_15.404412_1_plen_39_part_01
MLDDAADHRAEYTNIFMMESDTITPAMADINHSAEINST